MRLRSSGQNDDRRLAISLTMPKNFCISESRQQFLRSNPKRTGFCTNLAQHSHRQNSPWYKASQHQRIKVGSVEQVTGDEVDAGAIGQPEVEVVHLKAAPIAEPGVNSTLPRLVNGNRRHIDAKDLEPPLRKPHRAITGPACDVEGAAGRWQQALETNKSARC